MTSHTRRRSIRVSRSNHLITRSNTQYTQNKLHASSRRIQAHRRMCLATHRNQLFKLFGTRACRNPSRPQGITHLRNLRLCHIRGRKWNISHKFSIKNLTNLFIKPIEHRYRHHFSNSIQQNIAIGFNAKS